MLGFWLMASPFIFRYAEKGERSPANELLCGLAVVVLGLLSFWNRTQRMHLLILLVAAWLILSGYLSGYPSPPAAQNQIVVGLVLGMFAIIPNRANEMPDAWRQYYDKRNIHNR
jgi:hypothetical protein